MNARSRIKLYWTTDPHYMGYGSRPEQWKIDLKKDTPDVIGTPGTIAAKWIKEQHRAGLTGGIYFIMRMYCDGKQVFWDDIDDFNYCHKNKDISPVYIP